MKNLLILIVFALAACPVYSQEIKNKIPQAVTARFSELYPDVDMTGIDWDKEEGIYEANFSEEGKRNKAQFDNKGNWMGSELKDITVQELPQNIIDVLYFSQYGDWKTDDIKVMMNQNEMLYEIEVTQGLRDEKIYFDKEGNMTDKETL